MTAFTRGGSNTNGIVAAFAEALGRRPQVALVRRILADACRRRGHEGTKAATYPFVVTSLAALCVDEFGSASSPPPAAGRSTRTRT